MTTEEKIKRIIEIGKQIAALEREIEDILEGKGVVIGMTVPVSPAVAERIRDSQKPIQMKGHACCGSKIYRHKSTCENAKKLTSPPQKVIKKQEEDEALRCGECEYKFIGKISGECEKCGSSDIYRMPEEATRSSPRPQGLQFITAGLS